MILVGVIRELLGNLPRYDPTHLPGTVPVGAGTGLAMGVVVLRCCVLSPTAGHR
ncbi:MAG: hypothetical protein ACRDQU_11915 [Pseudonocardiaceae bacterium]